MPKLNLAAVKSFVAAVPGALKGHLNTEEIGRIVVATAVTAGVSAIPGALLASVGSIVAPGDVALATALVTLGTEAYRRLGHGALPPHSL